MFTTEGKTLTRTRGQLLEKGEKLRHGEDELLFFFLSCLELEVQVNPEFMIR